MTDLIQELDQLERKYLTKTRLDEKSRDKADDAISRFFFRQMELAKLEMLNDLRGLRRLVGTPAQHRTGEDHKD